MLRIDLLRHGALVGGVKYRGLLDDPLTLTGRKSMDAVWQQVKHEVTSIICSPLSRCANPAHEWAAETKIKCVEEPKIQELYYGEWEGKSVQGIQAQYPNMLEAWRKDPTQMTPPNGEPMLDFSKRVHSFLHDFIIEHQEGHVLLVAHSGSIRMLIAHVLQAPIVSTRHLSVPYACWSRVEITDGMATLCFHGKG